MILQQQNFTCTNNSILLAGGQIVENQDGSVSLFMPNNRGVLSPVSLSQECCTNLGYSFDIETQTCLWGTGYTCTDNTVFNLVLNPNGNDGAIFSVDNNETCSLNIDFDFLIKVKCETLLDMLYRPNIVVNQDLKYDVLTQIEQQTALCESIDKNITNLNIQITNTNYSIICESQPNLIQRVANTNSLVTDVFSKTAFSNDELDTKTTASRSSVTQSIVGKTFCILEPNGLTAWLNIIGQDNYIDFLNGVPTSYTCQDVQFLYDLNLQDPNNPLIVPCTTPFGTKTALIEQLNDLINQQVTCQKKLNELSEQLITLEGTTQVIPCSDPINFFETISLSLSLEVINQDNTVQTVYTDDTLFPLIGDGMLYDYLINNVDSGFYVCGGDNCTPLILNLSGVSVNNDYTCSTILQNVVDALYLESGLSGTTNNFTSTISNSAFTSNWLRHTTSISDQTIINQIMDNKIRFSIKVMNPCGEVSILLDNINLEKKCDKVDKTNVFVTQNPGFNFERIIDNKKSWVNNDTPENRNFTISKANNTGKIRQTNYNSIDERLILNTKEIDLDISLASAIETDVWYYVSDNNCILTGSTTCNQCTTQCCGDDGLNFNNLMTQALSGVTTIEEFQKYITSELIDVKNRQTISSYPTLKALYDRYLNSNLYCGTNSSAFNYLSMEQFSNLLGNYWVDIIEQVIPATTIWGSVKIYSNTIFDQQKFKYRSYSSFFCYDTLEGETLPGPIDGSNHFSENVSVRITNLVKTENPTTNLRLNGNRTDCDVIYITQMNHGSEFVGTVNIINSNTVV